MAKYPKRKRPRQNVRWHGTTTGQDTVEKVEPCDDYCIASCLERAVKGGKRVVPECPIQYTRVYLYSL